MDSANTLEGLDLATGLRRVRSRKEGEAVVARLPSDRGRAASCSCWTSNSCRSSSICCSWVTSSLSWFLKGENYNRSLFIDALSIFVTGKISILCIGIAIEVAPCGPGRKEGNVLFNDALNTFYLRIYGVRHMVKDHSDSEKGNPLPPHRLLFPINIPWPLLHQLWSTGWNEKSLWSSSICWSRARCSCAGICNSQQHSVESALL